MRLGDFDYGGQMGIRRKAVSNGEVSSQEAHSQQVSCLIVLRSDFSDEGNSWSRLSSFRSVPPIIPRSAAAAKTEIIDA